MFKSGNDAVFEKSLTVQGSTSLSGATSSGTVSVTGAVTATSPMTAPDFIKTSDHRIKRNLLPISDGLNVVLRLSPYLYEKDLGSDNFTLESGLIAHEVQEVINHIVNGKKDGVELQTVSYLQLIPYLIRAIQQQQEQINALQIKVSPFTTRYGNATNR